MTPQAFTHWAAAAFGTYLPAMKLEVEKWLGAHDGFFAAAMREIALREHPSVYGKPPGVHELEVWKIEAYQRGHTLEAIAAAGKSTTLIASDVEESYMSGEEALAKLLAIREMLAKKDGEVRE